MVHINKMICIGFKSFRKKTVINFDKGFSAIVGANGSGKSNIIDAFVFVLGALSAKTLRATNIKDLISNGGNGLGPAQTASVEIVFDNKDGAFGLGESEIRILRKIDRKGNGIYRLNDKRSTRKEIVSLLDLAGIIPNSSNMIMQGELFRLINMNSTQRRELVEDIAGISSYNERKLSAEDELVKVQTNLGQISLLLNEVYIQLEQLKKEKEDAEKYLAVVEQEKIRNNALYQVKINSAVKNISDMALQKQDIEAQIGDINCLEQDLNEQISQLEMQIEDLNPKIQALQDEELLQMTYRMKELKNKITEFRTSLKYANKNLLTYEKEQKDLQLRLVDLQKQEESLKIEIIDIEKNKQTIQEKIDSKNAEISDFEDNLQKIDVEYTQIKEESKNIRIQINNVKEDKAEISTSIKVLENQISTMKNDKIKNEKKIFENHEHLGKMKVHLKELEHEEKVKLGLTDFDDVSKSGMEKKISQLNQENIHIQEKLKKIKPLATETQKSIFEIKSRIKVVKQMNSGNRALKAIKKLQNSGKITGIHGTIAELGSIDPKFAIAMEMAAGSRFNFVVVDNQEIGEQCINYLKQNKIGRASFIPLDEIRYSSFNLSISRDPKIYGRAVDLITFDQKYFHAFEYVFGRTIIVEDLPTARHLKVSAKRVTLDGDVIDGSNLMSGGQKNKPKGIGFKGTNDEETKVVDLEYNYNKFKNEIDALELKFKSNAGEISRLYQLKISGANKTKEINEKIAICKSNIQTLQASIKTLEVEIEDILISIKELECKLETLNASLSEVEQKLFSLNEKEHSIQEKLDSSEESVLKQQLRNAEKELKKLTKIASQIEIEYTKKMSTLTETISNGRKEAQQQLNVRSISISETNLSISTFESDLKKTEIEASALDEKIVQKSAVVANLLNNKKNLQFEVSEKKTSIGQLNNDRYPLKVKLNTFEIKSSELDMKIQEWKCHILPEILIPQEFLSLSESKHQLEIEKLLDQKNSLGAVNLRAIEKYSEIQARFTELEQKNEQVIQEREAILQFIEALESEKLKVFMNTFNAINANFGYIFSRLSPNGEARLELENLEDPFAGGVQIVARPGEKEKCNVMALSGGERTLTIIALILGIQMHVPSPYYILDEIDAALDDVNAALVADMIKELSEKSQFIIITHRDVTMARVDHLLGVSNIEGVTSVINLSIKKVLQELIKGETPLEESV
ncbi:Chromosome partition protein Smc [Candidatus Lokiarchaeum ossiferum]|uniref:Chromosome partition protein Smc n=1 Tax=Candidatus Lokiarchaeum ossiferum TaxID=2951803 RepID=A0ABY6HRR5_9ARCH|nr:Chromosome partition protein Smc [Candidatus Lokiarchaeum sp. B-35]